VDEKLEELLSEFTGNPPASAESIALLEQHFRGMGKELPSDLRDVLETSDGAEGFINGHYLMLWGAAEIIEYQKSYQVELYAPGLLLFGSSGGGEAYAFDTRVSKGMPVVQVPFIGMDLEYADVLAPTFAEFLGKLKN
jgi:cell wall assembly regulator SMI1